MGAAKVLDGVVEEVVQQVAEDREDEAAADAVASVETKLETKLETTMEKIEAAAVTLATGSFPDIASDEGKAAIGADAFIFINFARLIVPARIAFALGLAPWVDENIVKKFGGDEKEE